MDRHTENPSMLDQALAYAAAGIPVFPCAPEAKTPLTAKGFHDATLDVVAVARWWQRHPTANVATPTGAPGFDVLDLDVRVDGAGWPAFHRARRAGLVDGWLRVVRTPSGGLHLHYPGSDQRNGSVRGQHLDFRGRGGYVLLPPSRIRTPSYAGAYTVVCEQPGPGRHLDWTAVSALLAPPPSRSVPACGLGRDDSLAQLVDFVARQREGNRDNGLFWAACRAAEAGHQPEPLIGAAIGTGLPERQARRTVRSAYDTIGRQTPVWRTSTVQLADPTPISRRLP